MRELPQKEANLFKQILKNYELKQYKKGLKGAEQILKKFPEHGETMAMKGLFYSHLDKKEEAYEFVKKGLRYDLKSHICWHVFGLLYRADKNYEEALKCYTQALRIDKDNMQILRDYSLLQMQLRNYEAYIETRHQLLELRPQNRMYWIGLAVAYHMMGKNDLAVKVLSAYEDSLKDIPTKPDYEHSEMLLYHNSILGEAGDMQVALDHLDSIDKHVCDRRAVREKRAQYLMALDRYEEAEAIYRGLVKENPDNFAYIEGLQKSLKLYFPTTTTTSSSSSPSTPASAPATATAQEQEKILALFDELQKLYPRSNACKRLPLRVATGEAFVRVADAYFQHSLRKGVPSLFVNIKKLYADSDKEKACEKLVLDYEASLKEHGRFDAKSSDSGEKEPPTALLWTLYYIAQHYDYTRQTDKALAYIERAIAHTPTLVELYMTKGRILKHAGKPKEAMEAMNEARELDLQDRFINSKCVKYMLRADKVADAEKTATLFTRVDIADPLNDLVDMQAMWYSLESGESHMRQGQMGKALKRFHQVEKHFFDFTDDQFDFHTYCLRKMTLRSYVALLRLEDQLRTHPYYVRAVKNAVQCYVMMVDKPEGCDTKEMEGMTEAEKKKHRNKQRKAELKAQKEYEERRAQIAADPTKKGKLDEDPEGMKFLKTEDPLGEALKFLRPLQELAPNRIETHLWGFEIYIRKKKLLLALRALLKAHALDANNETLKKQLLRFAEDVKAAKDIKPSVKAVIDNHWATLYGKEAVGH
ncbi:hypothetical protein DFQ27_000908 [Actinomortierella ambigua]|uniref:Uncharacterized protein n=1 Tax=Actinomortierella ambigua TaxID=1343610 RepID=A0A9P6QES7_9FUNG|nr:hypothetical protein DFQ26_008587 [Actinomortierella ambigua]KAG0264963.1 hypothetical protein DFQ27_000908 [Actinomortierella ambigua]